MRQNLSAFCFCSAVIVLTIGSMAIFGSGVSKVLSEQQATQDQPIAKIRFTGAN